MFFSNHAQVFPAIWLSIAASLVACSSDTATSGAANDDAMQALLRQDAAFAAMVNEQGVAAAYREFLADDAVQLPDGGLPIIGRQAIFDNILATLSNEDITLTWGAKDAAVSLSGDLGYTWGNYYFETVDESGEIFGNEGKYVNIWRKSTTGIWRVILDISNQNEIARIESVGVGLDETDTTEIF